MAKQHFTRSELLLFAAPIFVAAFGLYVHSIHRDTFSRDLQTLAGSSAVYCETQECEVMAFSRQQPFWTRKETHTGGMLSCSGGSGTKVSLAHVYTPDGAYYVITRYPAYGLRPARITKKRWINPKLMQTFDGAPYLWRYAEVEVEE
jgi:hypothetical protein